MNIEQIKSKILVLRSYHKNGLELADELLKSIESMSASNPPKRRNLKKDRVQDAKNYLASGKWRRQNPVTKL
jgi:hypothetical protein